MDRKTRTAGEPPRPSFCHSHSGSPGDVAYATLRQLQWWVIRSGKCAAQSAWAEGSGVRVQNGGNSIGFALTSEVGKKDSMIGVRQARWPGCPGGGRRAAGRVVAIARDPR